MLPVILVFIRFYLPGHKSGGPVRTISNMVELLGDDFEYRIVTSDRDMLESIPYAGIKAGSWNHVGKAWVYYVPHGKAGLREWASLINETPYDVLYLNSLFDPIYTLWPLLAQRIVRVSSKPVVIAPRGEFSSGALSLKSWKKEPYLTITKAVGLYRNVLWHASTEDEARLIRQKIGVSSNVVTACDLPTLPPDKDFLPERKDLNGPLRIVFLSRISRMKNLEFALKVLHKSRIDIQFDIWGTLEDAAYWEVCQQLILTMPDNVEVRYRGVADYADVDSILTGYDLFFLPTRGENYGHVIAEALGSGTPVLISNQTPWHNLAAQGVGWDLPLDDDGSAFLQAIEATKDKTATEHSNWRKRVFEYAKLHLRDPSNIEANRQVFLQAIRNSAGETPTSTNK